MKYEATALRLAEFAENLFRCLYVDDGYPAPLKLRPSTFKNPFTATLTSSKFSVRRYRDHI